MRRSALLPVVLATLAGCGGSPDPPDAPPGPPPERVVSGELRSPDARSPFVLAGAGAWRCPSDERIQLAISADGEVSLTSPAMALASVARTRALVNRACDRAAGGGAARTAARSGRVGASIVRCDVPPVVVVDFGGEDLTVRAEGGRYLAGAAVRADRIGVAGYWGDGCHPLSGG